MERISDVQVQKWVEDIEKFKATHSNESVEYCKKVIAYAEKNNRKDLQGFCLYRMGYCYYAMGYLDRARDSLNEAQTYLLETEQWEYLAGTYNTLGLTASNQGDKLLEINYFLQGLRYCHKYELYKVEYYIHINMATLYMEIDNIQDAILNLKKCEELMEIAHDLTSLEKYCVFVNSVICYIRLREKNEADKYYELAKAEYDKDPCDTDKLLLLCLKAEILDVKGETEERDRVIEEIRNLNESNVVIYQIADDLFNYANMLLRIGKYEALWNVIEKIENLTDVSDNSYSKQRILVMKIRYYKEMGNHEAYLKETANYYELAEKLEKERNEILVNTIKTRVSLEEEFQRRKEMEEANQMLKQKSERDALTGISNRYKLNEVSEEAFQNAFQQETLLGVEILDIDCFKEYNDNYGHQAGDEILVQLAGLLKKLERHPGVHVGRYGGDEFLIIFEGYDKTEIEAMQQELYDNLERMNLKHEYSKVADRVTISQGAFVRVPIKLNKTWDFLYAADNTLYQVKKLSRNGHKVSTNLSEIA